MLREELFQELDVKRTGFVLRERYFGNVGKAMLGRQTGDGLDQKRRCRVRLPLSLIAEVAPPALSVADRQRARYPAASGRVPQTGREPRSAWPGNRSFQPAGTGRDLRRRRWPSSQ